MFRKLLDRKFYDKVEYNLYHFVCKKYVEVFKLTKSQNKPVFLKIVKVITEISDRYFLGIFR